jgi:hypothetical protein
VSTIAHGDAESEGFKYRWMVYRDSSRAFVASVFVRREAENFEVRISKDLSGRPASKEAAKQLCDELVPELLKRLKQCEAGGTILRENASLIAR